MSGNMIEMQNKAIIIVIIVALMLGVGIFIAQSALQNVNMGAPTEQPQYETKPTDIIIRYTGILRQASLTADGIEGGIYYQVNNDLIHVPYETTRYNEAQKYIQCNILMTITYSSRYEVINVEIKPI